MSDRPPGIPGDLDSTGKALYTSLRKALRNREGITAWVDTDHHLLAQTCRYDQRARHIRESLTVLSDYTTEGDRKQTTVHPLVRISESAEKSFVDGLDKLGFTPRARAQMGLEPKKAAGGKFGDAFG